MLQNPEEYDFFKILEWDETVVLKLIFEIY